MSCHVVYVTGLVKIMESRGAGEILDESFQFTFLGQLGSDDTCLVWGQVLILKDCSQEAA